MPPHLTRQVFRRILANEPILHRGCLRRQQHNGNVRSQHNLGERAQLFKQQRGQDVQRRTMFNLASMFGKKREPAGASMDPGLDKMMELEKMTRLKARLPSPEDVAEAMRVFNKSRFKNRKLGIEDNQAQLFLQGLRYCQRCELERHADGVDVPFILSRTALIDGARVLRSSKVQATDAHVELAKALYDMAQTRSDQNFLETALLAYVRVLALSGSPEEALDVATRYQEANPATTSATGARSRSHVVPETEGSEEDIEAVEGEQSTATEEQNGVFAAALGTILQGFATYGPHEKVDQVLKLIEKYGALSSIGVTSIMQQYCLKRNNFASALHWWQERRRLLRSAEWESSDLSSATHARQMLDWCLVHDEIEAGHRIVQELADSNPSKPEWDIIFVWAAGTKKSVDEIDRMIGIMVQSNESIKDRAKWRLPDVATINALVEFAISRDDPYMAERFIALGHDHNIEPNAKTLVLQMDYRLQVGDVNGALIAYKNLQEMDLSSNEDVPTVNRLIVALCKTQRHDFDTIMNVAADLSDRRARFEPDTVTTLCLLHLRRDERYDTIDLLNTHAYHFSSTERESIRSALVEFALDSDTPTSRSWDAYTILRELFDEMPRTQRTDLMTSFMRRERPDMGVHVFQNMRMHSRADTMPTIETYVAAFMALAKMRELDSLEVVHNQLKLDFNIQPSTYLLNALIIAYTACGKPRHALDYWDEIAVSREGPSYNSVHVALRACEKAAFGDLKAQEIWSVLRKRGVELDQSLWASYAAALAGNGDNEMAFKALEEAVERGEVEVDEFVLGSLFAAGANREKQGEIERWAKHGYERAWERLEAKGVETNLIGERQFRIDRSVAP